MLLLLLNDYILFSKKNYVISKMVRLVYFLMFIMIFGFPLLNIFKKAKSIKNGKKNKKQLRGREKKYSPPAGSGEDITV